MKYLTKTVETYRVADEAEAAKVIEEAKTDNRFSLIKYEAVHKEKKAKGEVVDEWIRVTLHKAFNEEADPEAFIDLQYKRDKGVFPEPIEKEEEKEELPWE